MSMWLGYVLALALAQAEGPEEDASRAAFVDGQRLFVLKRYAEAGARFEAVFEARKKPAAAFNRAQCLELMGDTAGAIAWYHRYLRQAPSARDAEEVRAVIVRLARRQQVAGRQVLTVFAEPDSASITVDDGPPVPRWFSAALEPGPHVVRVTAPEHVAALVPVQLSAEAPSVIVVPLEREDVPPPPPVVDAPLEPGRPSLTPPPPEVLAPVSGLALAQPPAPAPRLRPLKWIGLGAGGAGLLVGAAFGAATLSAAAGARPESGGPLSPEEARRVSNDARAFATVTNVGWGVGAAGLLLAGVLQVVGQ